MNWTKSHAGRTVSVNQPLAMAAWWVVTRSMVMHALILSTLLAIASHEKVATPIPSYHLLLHWAPLWTWSAVLIVAALTWLFSRGTVCVVAGIVISFWFFSLASAFLTAWATLDAPGTTVTGWVTYGFLGWLWMCVTYVVWKDGDHVNAEEQAHVDNVFPADDR